MLVGAAGIGFPKRIQQAAIGSRNAGKLHGRPRVANVPGGESPGTAVRLLSQTRWTRMRPRAAMLHCNIL
jgi:hypothetical protein